MSIEPASPVPVFQQIADYIRRRVAAGVFRPGELVPSVRNLALELKVNPNTVQRAYEALEREQLIEARKGLGFFVSSDGFHAAREQSRDAVRGNFVQGIHAGRQAGLSDRTIRTTFEQAWQMPPAAAGRGPEG